MALTRYVVCLAAVLWAWPADATVLKVPFGGDVQAALDKAAPGDTVELEATVSFFGNFALPVKPFGPVITVTSSGAREERTIAPWDAPLLATLGSPNGASALQILGAANWRIDGIRFAPNAGGAGNVIECQRASSITFDRTLIVGDDTVGQKRAVLCNGTNIVATRNYWANLWGVGVETQAFLAYDGAGPYTLRDNYLEAASENVMFGGADSSSAAQIPSDILVERNILRKRPEWRGQPRVVKNLFELKSAKRVTLRENVLDGAWPDGQAGYAIQLTPRNQDGTAPWSVVTSVTIERNTIFNATRGINLLGVDDAQPSGRMSWVTIRDNDVVVELRFLQIGGEVGGVYIYGNRVFGNAQFLLLYAGDIWPAGQKKRPATYATSSLTLSNNRAWNRSIAGDNTGGEAAALTAFCLQWSLTWAS